MKDARSTPQSTAETDQIRFFEAADADDVTRVCVHTAATGGDATGLYSSDDLMPDIFARPYLRFAPDLALVVQHEQRVRGYILAVADTRKFVAWFRAEWVPMFEAKHARIGSSATGMTADSREADLVRLGLTPERMLVAEVDDYPAHLHIDLMPELQGRGNGRALIDRLSSKLADRGIRGLHLTMDPANVAARAFYDRIGFVELPSSTPQEPVLGIRLG